MRLHLVELNKFCHRIISYSRPVSFPESTRQERFNGHQLVGSRQMLCRSYEPGLHNSDAKIFCTPPSSVHVTVRVLSNLHNVQGIWAGGQKVLTLELGQNVDPNRSPNFFQTRQQSETKLSLGCSIHNSEQQALKVQAKKHDNTNKPNHWKSPMSIL